MDFRLKRLVRGDSCRMTSLALAVLLLVEMPCAISADLNGEVNDMFDNLGVIGNYTAPGAFKSQVYNTYTGGSFYMRARNKTYTLATIRYPNVKAGCGGIDFFAGSFSHISGQEIRDMMRNITAALPGVAFRVAMDVLSPMLGGIGKHFESILKQVTGEHINSCEKAIGLVRSAAEKVGFDTDEACAKVYTAVHGGDQAQAKLECQRNRTPILNTARTSSDPEIRKLANVTGNIVWKALQSMTHLDDREREMIMSITGTIVYPRENESSTGIQYPAQVTSVRQLLYGEGDAGDGRVRMSLLRCNNYSECDSPFIDDNYIHTGFLARTVENMRAISDRIRAREALPNDSNLVGFVNSVSEPVYRMLSIGNTNLSLGLADALIDQYAGVIAADYAYTFIERNIRLGMGALLRTYELNQTQAEDMAKLMVGVRATLQAIGQEKQTLYTKVQSVQAISAHLESLERQLRAGMPQNVVDMLGYQAAFVTK